MAKAKPAAAPKTEVADSTVDNAVPKGFQEPTGTGTVINNPPVLSDKEQIEKTKAELAAKAKADKELIEKTKADLAAKAKADKEAAAKVKADAKAAKDLEINKEKAAKAEARAKSKAEREARIAALAADGKVYTGSMLALADRVKQGVYVPGATGQLRSNDELAIALDGVAPTDVIRIGLDMLKIEDNPYTALNVGQQSMNLRNRMRGAIKKDTLTIAAIKEYIVRNEIHIVDPEAKAKAKAEKAEAVAKAKAEKAEAVAKAKLDTAGNAVVDGKTPGQKDAAEKAATK